jgi:hypothetical protein
MKIQLEKEKSESKSEKRPSEEWDRQSHSLEVKLEVLHKFDRNENSIGPQD